jgi:hypothetical protein
VVAGRPFLLDRVVAVHTRAFNSRWEPFDLWTAVILEGAKPTPRSDDLGIKLGTKVYWSTREIGVGPQGGGDGYQIRKATPYAPAHLKENLEFGPVDTDETPPAVLTQIVGQSERMKARCCSTKAS